MLSIYIFFIIKLMIWLFRRTKQKKIKARSSTTSQRLFCTTSNSFSIGFGVGEVELGAWKGRRKGTYSGSFRIGRRVGIRVSE